MVDDPVWRKHRTLRLFSGTVSLLICLLLLINPARADSLVVSSARLGLLNTQQFPRISATLEVRDTQGRFLHDLQLHQVRILEDERPLPVAALEEMQPGAQFVVAINPGRSFAIRDGQGFSRFDRLAQALGSWAAVQKDLPQNNSGSQENDGESGQGGDDYSLLINDGPQAAHLSSAAAWLEAFNGYQADLRSADARLDVLVQALEVASDEPPRSGMGRLILFITPPPEGDFSAGLEAIIARARQQGIRICIWLVTSPELFSSPGAVQLQELAVQTGGSLFAYSGVEPVPNPEDLLASMRAVYHLEYESHLSTGGPHQVAAEVLLEGFDFSQTAAQGEAAAPAGVMTPPQAIELDIQPPNPVFIEPPDEIRRESRGESENGEPILTPREQTLDVLVEFPDGFMRPVVTLTLYVDGQVVAVAEEPPFKQIIWNLDGYVEDGAHHIRVEAIDSLGLRSSSREIPVHIIVRTTPRSLLALLSRNASLFAGLAVVLSGAVLALVLILGGRIRPRHGLGAWRRGGWLFGRARKGYLSDPVTQPVRGAYPASGADAANGAVPQRGVGLEPSRRNEQKTRPAQAKTVPAPRQLTHWMDRLQRHPRRAQPSAHAALSRLAETEQATVPTPIPITSDQVIFGKDPGQVTLVLSDPSIEPVHARLRLLDGVYRISDEGTTAGTWVNYTPVSKEGTTLEHGDLIHIGRIGFRFLIREPGRVRKPVVTREDRPS